MNKYITIIKKFSKNLKNDHVSESTAQCSYYTILSFIPFVVLVITLIQYTNIQPQTLFEAVSKVIPSSMNEIVLGIVQEVYSKSIGTISITILFTMWSAGNGLFVLNKGLQRIYECDKKEKTSYIYLRIKAIIATIVFILLIVAGLVALVFRDSLINIIQEHFGGFKNFDIVSSMLAGIGAYFITFIVFLLVYKFIPKHNIKIKYQIYGAVFGAIGLNAVSFVFSRFLYIFKGFSIMYGSLTTLVLIMMWTYACFYTVFLGAEISKFINDNSI